MCYCAVIDIQMFPFGFCNDEIRQTCDLVTCVLNRCKQILKVRLVLSDPMQLTGR